MVIFSGKKIYFYNVQWLSGFFFVFAIEKCNAWYNLFVCFSKISVAALVGTFRFRTNFDWVIYSFCQVFPELKCDVPCPCLYPNTELFSFENPLSVLQVICAGPQLFSFRPKPNFSSRQIEHVTENQWHNIVYFKKRRYHNFGYYMVEIQNCDILA